MDEKTKKNLKGEFEITMNSISEPMNLSGKRDLVKSIAGEYNITITEDEISEIVG